MYQRAWIGSERPTLLFDLATKRLVDKKVVLPGVTVLERLVSGSREHAERRLPLGLRRGHPVIQGSVRDLVQRLPELDDQPQQDRGGQIVQADAERATSAFRKPIVGSSLTRTPLAAQITARQKF
ncbi:DUF4158 domain-containing protein [Streptacidiphilus sp. PB12-B1b]|uniref:DUF4158 domain-containing protein n=1 Tax=Streptacidiphilus sp. PB12-B1b TaxID=2705012 RepID=UPI0015FE5493|nr:DUF4158 domain-containing protein [Streptacidiphilus sp. PB12-B1b]QMU78808.1 DUF4158 domain-containing protein [Streptacidiphilus sp. PB12-B1b]